MADVVVLGQIGRDLVLRVDELPAARGLDDRARAAGGARRQGRQPGGGAGPARRPGRAGRRRGRRPGRRPGPRAGGGDGDLVAWVDGELLLPQLGEDPVDPTGAGDSYVAALTAALLGGAAPEDAAWFASSAAALCVTRAGGRPALSPDALRSAVHRFRGP
jgi:sugar/nucleoside kinase (ribokinase family)